MLDTKISLKHFISREFFKAALLPLLVIEIALVAMYFSVNTYTHGKSVETLKKESISHLEEIVDHQALTMSEQLRAVTSLSHVLQAETKRLFEDPEILPQPQRTTKFGFAPNGVYYKLDNYGGCSVFYSTRHPIGTEEKEKAARSEVLDPVYKHLFKANSNIVAVYFNTFDSMCRYYPFIDKVFEQFVPDMNIPDFNFYYLADAEHNPEGGPVWTEAYLDPAGLGWMMSCVVPIYSGAILEGVAGIDITIKRFIDNILTLELPWDSHAFVVDSEGTIMAMPSKVERILGLKELKEHVYSGKVLQDTYKPEEYNLLKGKMPGTTERVSRLIAQEKGVVELTIGSKTYFLTQATVAETGWKLMVLADKEKILEPIFLLERNSKRVGYAAVGVMAVFYFLFFCYLLNNTRRISGRIASPVDGISKASIQLAAGEYETQLDRCHVWELDDLSRNFESMAQDLKELHESLKQEVERANKATMLAKQAEEALLESEERFRKLSDAAEEAIAIHDEGVIVDGNEALARLFGYELSELIGMSAERLATPETWKIILGHIATGYDKRYEGIGLRKDGSSFYGELVGKPYQYRGKTLRVVTFRDITERIRAEQALRKSEERLKLALEGTNDGIWDFRPQTNEVYYSLQWLSMLGYMPDELPGVLETWAKLLHPDDRAKTEGILNQFLENKDEFYFAEFRMLTKDGKWKWIIARGKAVEWDDDGNITRIVGTHTDITKRKHAEEALEKAHTELEERVAERTRQLEEQAVELTKAKEVAEAATKARTIFLANMSHEIRTPMNAILGFTRLARNTDLTFEQGEYLDRIGTSSNLLLAIINEILDFSKIEAGKLDIHKVKFQLHDIVDDLADLFIDEAGKRQFEMIIGIDRDVPTALVSDPLRIRQVLVNLTGNAVKFTKTGEIFIHVTCVEETKDSAKLSFMVRDTGIGIPQENIKDIFSAFTQVDSSFTRKYSGTGLGLPISKQIVELLGGKISVESEPGKGSAFSFAIPLEKQSVKTESPYQIDPHMRGLKGLLVDDNINSRHALTEMMASFGCEVVSASTAEEALKELKAHVDRGTPYQIVLMDFKMPGLDGFAASKKIRTDSRLSSVPIIMMLSSHISEQEMLHGISIGINAFLEKPIKSALLFDTLVEVSGKKSLVEPAGRELIVAADRPSTSYLEGAKVLLAEDNATNQEVISKLLGEEGIIVDIVDNGKDAVEAVGKTTYAAVLMDMQMPEMDGYEATATIRKDAGFVRLPIIAMTAHAMRGDRERCLKAGMDDYVSKPIDPDHLFAVLTRWIRHDVERDKEYFITPMHKDYIRRASISIPGVDVGSALRRLRGDSVLYKKLLKDFISNSVGMVDELKDALAQNNMERILSLAHNLKGVAGNLSATKLLWAAGNLEAAVKQRDMGDEIKPHGIDAKVNMVEEALSQLLESAQRIEEITEYEPKPMAEARSEDDLNITELRPMLVKLSELLTEKRTDALDLVESMTRHSYPFHVEKELLQLEEELRVFDFEKAQKTLKIVSDIVAGDQTG